MYGIWKPAGLRATGLCFAAGAFLCLSLGIASGQKDDPGDLKTRLGGDGRYLTHVSTDKPVYRPGEIVYVRAVMIEALTRKPMAEGIWTEMEIVSPKGDSVARGGGSLENGAFGWQWTIGPEQAGGDYKVKIAYPGYGYPPAEREFNIRAFRAPRLRTQIVFGREGYGPGDEVTATLEASRAEGGVPAGAKAVVVARVDREETYRGETVIGEDGFATARFTLPKTIAIGDGTLSFAIEDGGVVESAAKTIPILVSVVDLSAYPEGGDLIAGLENRVYFEAIAPNGRPADVTVELLGADGKAILEAATEHEGRGSFVFAPKAGEAYRLKVSKPWTVKTEIDMPKALERGVVLRAVAEKYEAGAPIRLEAASNEKREVRIQLSNREQILGVAKATVGGSAFAPIEIEAPADACGALRATAYDDATGKPLAERLVFVAPGKTVNISFEMNKESFVPGDSVGMKIRTSGEDGKPVKAVVGLTVTDDSTLELIETRLQAPRLPVMVFLEPEVRELADAQIYLSDDPEAPRALDLLLGTQGWRRFAFVDVEAFLKKHGDAARRALAQRDPPPVLYSGVPPMRFMRGDAGAMEDGAMALGFAMPMAAAAPEAAMMDGMEIVEKAAGAPMEALAGEVEADVADFEPEAQAMAEAVAAEPAIEAKAKLAPPALAPAAAPPLPGLDVEGLMRMPRPVPPPPQGAIMAARVYAHLYWCAAVETNAFGEAVVEFALSDSVTSFRATADAYTADGVFGAGDTEIESRRPFYVEAKTPLETTAGDRVDLPVVLVNETEKAINAQFGVALSEGLRIGPAPRSVDVPAHSRKRVILKAQIEDKAGTAKLTISAGSGEYFDTVTREIAIKPLGFPIKANFGGLLEGEAVHAFEIPASLTEGGLTATAAVFPTPLGNLTAALEALIRDPYGCFEQTSSTNYPLVMAMQYFQSHTGVDPALVRQSKEKLASGYERLIGFECGQKGYEWFGEDPGHEALTAYGLLEFADMAQVHPVDPQMIERTKAWLLARRDGKGGFARNPKALDSFGGAPDEVTNAYIVWALASTGEKSISPELGATAQVALKSEDPYIIALAAGAMLEADRADQAAPLLKRLAEMQDKDGSVPGAKTSVTRSGGQSLLIETTSLAALAWLKDKQYAAQVEKAMRWICEACEGGRFGSTQSTVLALKAIIAYDMSRARPKAAGRLALTLDGELLETIDFGKDAEGALEFKNLAGKLLPGKHELKIAMEGGSPMPYAVEIEYFAETPANAEACPLRLEIEPASIQAAEGDPADIVVKLRNTKNEGLPMTLAIVGLPGGMEPRHDQLKERVKEGLFDFYEVNGRELALYWRSLAPNAEKEVSISCLAAVPGAYKGPASRVYLYYTPEEKQWVEGAKAEIEAKK